MAIHTHNLCSDVASCLVGAVVLMTATLVRSGVWVTAILKFETAAQPALNMCPKLGIWMEAGRSMDQAHYKTPHGSTVPVMMSHQC